MDELPITWQESRRRARLAREATVNVALEGFTFSPEQDADVEAFVRGEITVEEVTSRTLTRHKKL